jgi:outer membrane protein assembly factor BamE (lipoprotein component of BamABCDE complex)
MTSLSMPRHRRFRHLLQFVRSILIGGVWLLGLAGCGERVSEHGQFINESDLATITIGSSTRADIVQRLGQPSFEGAFDANKLYYTSQHMVEPAGGNKTTKSRIIYMFTIDNNNKLESIDLMDEKSGLNIAHIDEKTPTPGDTYGVIEQIFSNLRRTRSQ